MPSPDLKLRSRQIHLDFHTGPWVPDIGANFDPDAFARTMADAHVDSVTVFAKCHHGHLYYKTDRPERHPNLPKNLDLLRGQVDALHAVGIRAPIYISVMCDEYAANTHPEWVAVNPDGTRVGATPLKPGWQIMDMSSPYQEFLYEQTEEVLKAFDPVDGIFFDMCWDQVSVSQWARRKMAALRLDPECEDDRNRYARQVAMDYTKRFTELVHRYSPEATLYFNGRPVFNLRNELDRRTHNEIESLPTGGWGYMFFPMFMRYQKTLGLPCLGMTARFHKTWSDFGGLKPQAALDYEVRQMIAHGAQCSIGDQLHPDGTLDKAAYERIGSAYEYVERCQPFCDDAATVADIALIKAPAGWGNRPTTKADEGAVRMLMELKHQFDWIDVDRSLEPYKVAILTEDMQLDAKQVKKLQSFVKGGGKVIFSGSSAFDAEGRPVMPEQGIKAHGMSPFVETYIRFGKDLSAGVPDTDHVNYQQGMRITAGKGASALARVVEPFFQRNYRHFCGHNQTPAAALSKYAAAVRNGNVVTVSFPVFKAYGVHANVPYRLLVGNILDKLLPDRLLKVDGPVCMETTVARQGKRTVVHLLAYVGPRKTEVLDIIEDVFELRDVEVSLLCDKAPKSVTLQPTGEPLDFDVVDGRIETVVPSMTGHCMVVVE